jgi:surface antigen
MVPVDSGRGGSVSPASEFGGRLVMRTFRWNAPIIIGAGALVISVFAPASFPLKAEDWRTVVTREASAPTAESTELKAKLDGSDRQAATQALQLALNELGDGVTLVWRRPARGLEGRIKPMSAFRDDHGRVCRHLVYSLSLGGYSREVEGNACRAPDGSWVLSG